MHAVKLVRFADAVSLVLPAETLAALRCSAGDTVFLTQTAEGLSVSAFSPVLQEQLRAGRDFLRDYGDAMRMLSE